MEVSVEEPGSIDLRFWKTFAYGLFHPTLFLGTKPAAVNSALNCVQQLEPVDQRRLNDSLPLVIAFFARVKDPFPPDVLRINLQIAAILGSTFPAYLGFWHRMAQATGRSRLATAMAAMPSSRPIKPRCSLVVALIPTCWIFIPRASAMFNFIFCRCGAILGACA